LLLKTGPWKLKKSGPHLEVTTQSLRQAAGDLTVNEENTHANNKNIIMRITAMNVILVVHNRKTATCRCLHFLHLARHTHPKTSLLLAPSDGYTLHRWPVLMIIYTLLWFPG
jgi:hypothetical protein